MYGLWAGRMGADASQPVTGCRLAMASLDWAGWVSTLLAVGGLYGSAVADEMS